MANALLDSPVVADRIYLPTTTIRSCYTGQEFPAPAIADRHVALLRLAVSRDRPPYCGMFTNDECTPEERSALSVRGFIHSPLDCDGWVVMAEGRAFLAELDAATRGAA